MIEEEKLMINDKALAILYSPKSLIDFTWYYYAHGKDYKWDVVIVACDKEIKIKDQCEKSGIFENIYCDDVNYDKISRFQQAIIFGQMFFYWLIRRKKSFVKKFFARKNVTLNYSKHLIATNFCSLDSGLLQCFADEVPTVVLEDGMSDYVYRTTKFDKTVPLSIDSLISYIMCKMNYASLNQNGCARYITKNSLLCDKYSVHPEKMKYRGYRTISKLGEPIADETDYENYIMTLKRMYDLERLNMYGDVILFTAPLKYNGINQDLIVQNTVDFIVENYSPKSVYIKKHPRDNMEYVFPEYINVEEIPSSIPAELILELLKVNKFIFMYTTTILLSIKSYSNVALIVYDDLYYQVDSYRRGIDGDLETLDMPRDTIFKIELH